MPLSGRLGVATMTHKARLLPANLKKAKLNITGNRVVDALLDFLAMVGGIPAKLTESEMG
tara:strand:- start:171 stop:350 length:180 start_codon:yes stop_codon:yes gene_type:complete